MENSGILYVLTNPFMPGLVKIGCTTGPVEDRIQSLSSATGVPVAFQCHFAAQVDDTAVKEKTLHQLFSDKRVNPNREFFQVAPEKIVLAIRMGSFIEVTPGKVDIPKEEEQALKEAEEAEIKRRAKINLDAIGIRPGASLTLSRDENVHATVVSGNRVEYEGQIMSLSASALDALHKLGYTSTAASGSDYWMYEGKTLDEIRLAFRSFCPGSESTVNGQALALSAQRTLKFSIAKRRRRRLAA
jgi:T5orf172 domain